MGIKHSLGKLALKKPFSEIHRDWEANAIELLTISYPHIQVMQELPFHHRDPFDRILISQALYHNLPIISKDKAFDNYKGLIRLW
jgi:PIN domain nuclease of toxin-antitoxin system